MDDQEIIARFFARDEAAMRGFCDVYIKSFEELLLPPRQEPRP